jgi:DNA-binding NarL/FixJ family response regulator
MARSRAYVVEPQSLFVSYLVDALADSGIEVVRVTPRFDPALLETDHPQLVFLDLEVDTAFPEEVVRLARESSPDSRVVVYASGDPGPYRDAGADAVVSKDLDVDEFVRAMRAVAQRSGR